MLVVASGILGLGESPNSFGQTLALLITFIGIGIVVNVLIIYAVAQVLAERRENQERQQAYLSDQHHRRCACGARACPKSACPRRPGRTDSASRHGSSEGTAPGGVE